MNKCQAVFDEHCDACGEDIEIRLQWDDVAVDVRVGHRSAQERVSAPMDDETMRRELINLVVRELLTATDCLLGPIEEHSMSFLLKAAGSERLRIDSAGRGVLRRAPASAVERNIKWTKE